MAFLFLRPWCLLSCAAEGGVSSECCMLGVSIMQRAPSRFNTGYNRQVMGYSGVLQFQGELPSVLGSSLDELMRHVGSLRTQVLEVSISIFDTLCQLGSTSPHAGPEQGSQVLLSKHSSNICGCKASVASM